MYKFVTITAAVVIASTVSSLANPTAQSNHENIMELSTQISELQQPVPGPRGERGVQGARGEQGERGLTGRTGTQGYQGNQGIQGERGERGFAGANAYQIAVNGGYEGTQEQWFEDQRGEDGRDGTDGTNGRDGTNGTNGVNGIRGADGRDGIDYNPADHHEAIAGAAALSFANNGGSGLGFGIAGHEDESAAAISYTHEFNSRFSASFGGSTSGTAGGGFKFKF